MENIEVKIKKLRSNSVIPEYKSLDAAACDLVSCEEVRIPARGRSKVPTGIAVECENLAILLFARSGLAVNKGISLSTGVSVVDADYRGEIIVGLSNNTDEDYIVREGDRIAQMMFVPVLQAKFKEVKDLSNTNRGAGGFGSTGNN